MQDETGSGVYVCHRVCTAHAKWCTMQPKGVHKCSVFVCALCVLEYGGPLECYTCIKSTCCMLEKGIRTCLFFQSQSGYCVYEGNILQFNFWKCHWVVWRSQNRTFWKDLLSRKSSGRKMTSVEDIALVCFLIFMPLDILTLVIGNQLERKWPVDTIMTQKSHLSTLMWVVY